jgi:hypothetical protein
VTFDLQKRAEQAARREATPELTLSPGRSQQHPSIHLRQFRFQLYRKVAQSIGEGTSKKEPLFNRMVGKPCGGNPIIHHCITIVVEQRLKKLNYAVWTFR